MIRSVPEQKLWLDFRFATGKPYTGGSHCPGEGKAFVELGRDVVILLDGITRLTRAYNLVIPPSGRTLSGGLDPASIRVRTFLWSS